MTSGHKPGHTVAAPDPAVLASTAMLHHRRGWIWTLLVSLAGFIVAVAVAANNATGGTASFLLDLVGLVMLIVFVVALAMIFVLTARLRQHAPAVRGPALAAHRTARRPVLAHPHDHRHHRVGYVFGMLMLIGWLVGAVVFVPRLVDSVAYLAGAGGHATFMPTSYAQQCTARAGCMTVTNGILKIDGHPSAATWPNQVPLETAFTVREPVWRWALGSGLINGDGTAIGGILVGLIFEAGAVLAAFIILRPYLGRLPRRKQGQRPAWSPTPSHPRRR
jgi:hypothetical protein